MTIFKLDLDQHSKQRACAVGLRMNEFDTKQLGFDWFTANTTPILKGTKLDYSWISCTLFDFLLDESNSGKFKTVDEARKFRYINGTRAPKDHLIVMLIDYNANTSEEIRSLRRDRSLITKIFKKRNYANKKSIWTAYKLMLVQFESIG